MKVRYLLLAAIVSLAFSACNEGQIRRVSLGGKGVVTYVIKRPDMGVTKDGPVSQKVTISDVEAVRFYETYVVVEQKGGVGLLLNPDDVVNLEWKQ